MVKVGKPWDACTGTGAGIRDWSIWSFIHDFYVPMSYAAKNGSETAKQNSMRV